MHRSVKDTFTCPLYLKFLPPFVIKSVSLRHRLSGRIMSYCISSTFIMHIGFKATHLNHYKIPVNIALTFEPLSPDLYTSVQSVFLTVDGGMARLSHREFPAMLEKLLLLLLKDRRQDILIYRCPTSQYEEFTRNTK